MTWPDIPQFWNCIYNTCISLCTFVSLRFQAWKNKNITVCRLRGKNKMWNRIVTCHVLIILFLAGRWNCRGLQTLTKQILSLPGSSLFASHLEVVSYALCFGQELALISCYALSRVVSRVLNFSRIVIYWPELTRYKTAGSVWLNDFYLIIKNVTFSGSLLSGG